MSSKSERRCSSCGLSAVCLTLERVVHIELIRCLYCGAVEISFYQLAQEAPSLRTAVHRCRIPWSAKRANALVRCCSIATYQQGSGGFTCGAAHCVTLHRQRGGFL
jgi:hypothetical protein